MFKRIERKRKRQEEEESGLDGDTQEILGLDNTDSDECESESGSEQERAQSDSDSEPGVASEDRNPISEEEGVDADPPISVEEALRDPMYVISLDPTVHGCVLCKGKQMKNVDVAIAHKSSKVHIRRFQRFKLLSADADPLSNAWELVRANQATCNVQKADSQELSKRALKRQARQAAIRERRKRHKELKAKATAKKALKKLSADEKAGPDVSSEADLRDSPESQNRPAKPQKKQKLESGTTTGQTLDMTAKSPSRSKKASDSKKSILKSRIKGTQRHKGSQRAVIT